jgi:hypothetical protein
VTSTGGDVTVEEDVKVEFHATVHATRDEVAFACVRAASSLGWHAKSEVEPEKVTVKIFLGVVPVMTKVSPLVGITLHAGIYGDVSLVARIERYKTLQSRFYFIRLGPKRLRGKAQYTKLLRTLEQELRALDQNGQFQWVGRVS